VRGQNKNEVRREKDPIIQEHDEEIIQVKKAQVVPDQPQGTPDESPGVYYLSSA
jgi:hypothetical protein